MSVFGGTFFWGGRRAAWLKSRHGGGWSRVHRCAVAYDCTDGSTDRPFLETFLPDEGGAFTEGRIIRQHLMVAACTALLALKTDSARISRGLRQYELALREWYLGGEWLTLSHLHMTVETLTKAGGGNCPRRPVRHRP